MVKKCIVITGTSRGIGHELKGQLAKNFFIIEINRCDKKQKKKKVIYGASGINILGDFNGDEIWKTLKSYVQDNKLIVTQLFLNAGASFLEDNTKSTVRSFQGSFDVNFNSVIRAIDILGINFAKKFIYFSSMNTIYPNRINLAYALSKKSTEIFMSSLNKFEKNKFLVITLGPVNTSMLNKNYQNNGVFKNFILGLLALDVKDCVSYILKNLGSTKNNLMYPKSSYVIFTFLRFVRIFSFRSTSFISPS